MAEYTRDEYIAKFGSDPDASFADAERGDAANYGTSIAAGAAGAIPDVINLLPTIKRGAAALVNSYSNDSKFMDEFYNQTHIAGARDNVINHLRAVGDAWREQDPSLSDEEIQSGLDEYQKSKPFEDFAMSQLSNTAWLSAKVKDTTRKLLGDERPESQRSWGESAAEAVGGALVPGPAGWANAVRSGLGTASLTGRAANSLVGRGTLKTLEAITPLTMPYSASNVAINAVAGVGLDQAARYAQGQTNAYSAVAKDETGLGALAATGVGIVGLAAVVAAVKGHNAAHLENLTTTERAVLGNQGVDLRAPDQIHSGEASIIGGVEQQADPYAQLGDVGTVTSAARKLTDSLIDKGHVLDKAIESESGIARSRELEGQRTALTGSILNDRRRGQVEELLRPVIVALQAMPGNMQRAALQGLHMAGLKSDRQAVISHLDDRINDLTAKISNPETARQNVGTHQTELAQVRTDRQRLIDDVPDARLRIPDVPMTAWEPVADAFIRDTNPYIQRFRDAVKKWGDDVLDMQVEQGTLSQTQRDMLRNRNPYYTPTVDDPLKGATGMRRLYRSVVESAKSSITRDSMGTGKSVGRESPIESLDFDVNQPYADFNKRFRESRVTRPLEPMSAMRKYTEQMITHVSHTNMRNTHIRELGWVGPNVESQFQRAGYMERVRINGQEWFSAAQLDTPALQKIMDDPHVAPEWEGGRVRMWKFGDIEIASALRAEPAIYNGAVKTLATATRWFKQFTTGYGNPLFAIKGAGYDTMIGMLTRGANRAFGPASYIAHRVLPESWAKHIVGRIPDPTAIPGAMIHSIRAMGDVHAHYFTRYVAEGLYHQSGIFKVLANTMGEAAYNKMMNGAIKLAYITHNLPTMKLIREGVAHSSGTVDNIATVRGAHAMIRDSIPNSFKTAWQFYRDVINSVYVGPKRMFFTENHALLANKFKGVENIPQREIDNLIAETRALGGDMSKVPSSKRMQDIEAIVPYLTQTKLGSYHLLRNMAGSDTYSYVLPRMMLTMYGVGMSYYWRTYWNAESADDHWHRTSEYDRWRYISVPGPKLWMAWARGEDLPFSRDLFYNIIVPPDIVGLIAGTGAIMQTMGMIPASATPVPISRELPSILLDSMMPAMPPAMQALLGMSGMKLDPQNADIRGGNWIKQIQSPFRSGPLAEQATSLGQISTTTSLVMNSLFGAMGSHVAVGLDTLLHASRFDMSGVTGKTTERSSRDFAAGLNAATNEVYGRMKDRIPDIPLLWQNTEKYQVSTPTWKYVTTNNNYIRSITGSKPGGKQAQADTEARANVGGVQQQQLDDQVLTRISQEIAEWNAPNGELGKARKQYQDLAKMGGSLVNQYNMPQEERRNRINLIVKQQQDNLQQQHLMMKFKEAELSQNYGKYLVGKLDGRALTLRSLDQMMRESIGGSGSTTEQAPQ